MAAWELLTIKIQQMTIESTNDNTPTTPAITHSECYRQYGINVLSLFDGMSCGQIALNRVGIEYDKYYASEIDKHAIKVATHNYPDTIELGDINNWKEWSIDWSQVDLILAGSPCQGGIINDLFPKWKQLMKKQQTNNKQQNPALRLGAVIARFSLFSTGFIQVYFVAVNTYFIANEMYLGVLIAAFMISLIWSFNVKKVAFGSTTDRVVYAFGATCGSLVGLWSSSFIASVLNGL